ncbi:MAG: UDP-N-acetylmuramoyl-tripeptide--D-alanyl-D-alanine ligase [Treponema sp.]|nr:UDP-N-acetylmuramoyl-tripeptide--D-alanyl-D-alanine ligase [Treponema sp.]
MATDGVTSLEGGFLLEYSVLSRSLGADTRSFGNGGLRGFSSVSIDSRSVGKGALFTALSGSAHDGHSFVEAAFINGADAALVDRRKIEQYGLLQIAKVLGKTLIMVDDTLRALQDAARAYLEQFPRLIKIGITGSSGKTTTKEIAAAMIGAEKNTVMNPGNYNSETGMPLSAFAVRSCHEAGIFEMGMNRKGEIAELASVLNPGIASITNVGSAHIGIIGNLEAIALEKKDIFSRFNGTNTALIPEDSSFRELLAQGVKGKVSFYGEKSLAGFGGARSLGLDGSEISWAGESVRFALPGRHNLANALAAAAIAREIPVSDRAIRQGLESVGPLFGRGEILRGNVTVIQDCYNSNPESAAQALEFCESLDWPGRLVYVIGDMLELGDNSPKAHEDIGRLLLGSKADMVFLYGNEISPAAEVLKTGAVSFAHIRDMDELSRALAAYARGGDLVLLKGSRGCALERLSAALLPDVMRNQHEGVSA